jgi:hypothetical protein
MYMMMDNYADNMKIQNRFMASHKVFEEEAMTSQEYTEE